MSCTQQETRNKAEGWLRKQADDKGSLGPLTVERLGELLTLYGAECVTQIEKQWSEWGTVEIAVRNPGVAEYCRHWEERATRAEAQLHQGAGAGSRCPKCGSDKVGQFLLRVDTDPSDSQAYVVSFHCERIGCDWELKPIYELQDLQRFFPSQEWVSCSSTEKPRLADGDDSLSVEIELYVPEFAARESKGKDGVCYGNYLYRSGKFRPANSHGFDDAATHWKYKSKPPEPGKKEKS